MTIFLSLVAVLFGYLFMAGFSRPLFRRAVEAKCGYFSSVEEEKVNWLSAFWLFTVWFCAGQWASESLSYFSSERRESRRIQRERSKRDGELQRIRSITELASERERAGDLDGARQIRALLSGEPAL